MNPRRRVSVLSVCCVTILFGALQTQASERWDCIPTAKSFSRQGKTCRVDLSKPIRIGNEVARSDAEFLGRELHRLFGINAKIEVGGKAPGQISLGIGRATGKQEGYSLTVTAEGVDICGDDAAGLFHGVQTLVNLLKSEEVIVSKDGTCQLPCLRIQDYPGLAVRGMDMQWCYVKADLPFMVDTIRALAGLKMNVLVPELGPNLRSEKQPDLQWRKHAMSRKDFRALCRAAKENHIQIVPKINSLGHIDRGMPWPKPIGKGLDMGVEENYQALFDVVLEYKEDLASAGMAMPLFHFGMDEASACIEANVKKYNRPGDELLLEHVRKIYDFCKKHDIRMVIYHDMLIGSKEPVYWREMSCMHADKHKTYLARPKLPKDIIIDYWNYEAFGRYRTVEQGFRDSGFDVWLTPWAGASVRTMAENAKLLNGGLLGSTWVESGYAPELNRSRPTLARLRWVSDAIVNLAEFSWNNEQGKDHKTGGGYDPTAHLARLFWDRPTRQGHDIATQIELPRQTHSTEVRKLLIHIRNSFNLKLHDQAKGLPFDLSSPVVLGNPLDGKTVDIDSIVKERGALFVSVNGKKAHKIDCVNVPRKANQLNIYTRQFGRSTQTNQYGTEAIVCDGSADYKDEWGVGNSAIPRNGFVISGHGEGQYGLNKIPVGSKVGIVDVKGNPVRLNERRDVECPANIEIELNDKCRSLVFLHATGRETYTNSPVLVNVNVTYADGAKGAFDFVYGRDLCTYDTPRLLYGRSTPQNRWVARTRLGKPNAGANLFAYQWHNPNPEKVVKTVTLKATDAGQRLGYILLGLTSLR